MKQHFATKITFGINNPYSEATQIDGKCIFYGF